MNLRPFGSRTVLGMRVDAVNHRSAARVVERLALRGEAGYVCVANVHMTMEAYDDAGFRSVVNGADLVVADGKPLACAARMLGGTSTAQVRGADLVRLLARRAATLGLPVALYGGNAAVAQGFAAALRDLAPGIDVRTVISPPFGPVDEAELRRDLAVLREAGARIVFVGLGCPKQERWMAANTRHLEAVLVGVGAAFDFFAGSKTEAPRWTQRVGLEWLFRLVQEPRRLFWRYARHNPRFVLLFARQLLFRRNPAG